MAQHTLHFTAIMRQINSEDLARIKSGTHEIRVPIYKRTPMPAPNPKASRAVADGKAPLDYLETICDAGEARVLRGGADKYGRRNFADPNTQMRMSTYIGSMRRHLNAIAQGEDIDPESGELHLSHIRANIAVWQAAVAADTMVDDRLDTQVLARSSAVHVDGNQDAKSTVIWGGPIVEPFVVDAKCCCGDYSVVDEGCTYADGRACRNMVVR